MTVGTIMRLAGPTDFGAMRRTSRYRAALLATTALLSIILPATKTSAQQIVDGTTVNVPGTQSSPWNIGGSLTVGDTGAGRLNVISGGVVSSDSGFVGQGSGSNGFVLIDGTGSQWGITNQLDLGGLNGIGAITVQNGGALSSGNTFIASDVNSAANIFVTDSGSTWIAADISVGHQGNGTLTITNGGVVNSTGAGIGSPGWINRYGQCQRRGIKLDRVRQFGRGRSRKRHAEHRHWRQGNEHGVVRCR